MMKVKSMIGGRFQKETGGLGAGGKDGGGKVTYVSPHIFRESYYT